MTAFLETEQSLDTAALSNAQIHVRIPNLWVELRAVIAEYLPEPIHSLFSIIQATNIDLTLNKIPDSFSSLHYNPLQKIKEQWQDLAPKPDQDFAAAMIRYASGSLKM